MTMMISLKQGVNGNNLAPDPPTNNKDQGAQDPDLIQLLKMPMRPPIVTMNWSMRMMIMTTDLCCHSCPYFLDNNLTDYYGALAAAPSDRRKAHIHNQLNHKRLT